MSIPHEGVRVVVSRTLAGMTYLPDRRCVVPGRFEARATSSDWPWAVTLVLVVDEGRVVVDELTLKRESGAQGLSTEALRSIPLAGIARHAVDVASLPARRHGGRIVVELFGAGGEGLEGEGLSELPTRRARLTGPVRESLLRQIATEYRAAVAEGDHAPRVHVGQKLGFSSAYIGKLLVEARKKRFLEDAPGPGRPGEHSEEEKEHGR